jgi:hypothetical protein
MGTAGRIAVVALLVSMLPAGAASATTYKPTRLDDPAPNGCKPANCSLREAITQANKRNGADKVVLAEGTYELEQPEDAADDNSGGDLDVKGPVRIVGKGINGTTVDANGGSRVFSLLRDPAKSLEKMNITGGAGDDGAGVFVGPPKTNSSPARHKLKNLAIQANVAELRGGGVYASLQRLLVSRTTITGNHAPNGGGGMYLAAAENLGYATPPVEIRSSTFSGNTAGVGAGLYADGFNPPEAGFDPRVDVLNSTFAHNIATVSGGGISAIQGGSVYAEHTTVAYNAADSDSSGGGVGGGVHQSTSGVLELDYSLVKENTVGSSGDGPQCAGEIDFKGVITPQGTPGLCTFAPGSTIQGEPEARIGTLNNNGGPTQTIEINADSLANGWRDNAFCPAKDQRGMPRPETDCDAGAFERP